MKSAEHRKSRSAKPATRHREELAFLPAALEIVETPPPPLAGAIGGTIVALFCLGIAWASLGKVDIVATASGRIIPSDRAPRLFSRWRLASFAPSTCGTDKASRRVKFSSNSIRLWPRLNSVTCKVT
jgi:hypothetical protein